MPDNSIECIVGRMEQKMETISTDLKELKDETRSLSRYIDNQKVGMRIIMAIAVTLGSIFVYYKEHIEQIFFGTHK
jgi:hypothetical protein